MTGAKEITFFLRIIFAVFLLKIIYYVLQATGGENLLLKAIAFITGSVTGYSFTQTAPSEFTSSDGLFIIKDACSGWRLFMLYFLMDQAARIFLKLRSDTFQIYFFSRLICVFLVSFFVNIIRIVLLIQFHFLFLSPHENKLLHLFLSMLLGISGLLFLLLAARKEGLRNHAS
jgi:hypothetical protein